MYENLLKEVICNKYEEIREDNYNNNALILHFSCHIQKDEEHLFSLPNVSDESRYPKITMLIYGEYNYTGVYIRDSLKHPNKRGDWYSLSYHDSCWREDGVNTFLWKAGKIVVTWGTFPGHNIFQVTQLTDNDRTILREARNKRYNSLNPKIHPLFINRDGAKDNV